MALEHKIEAVLFYKGEPETKTRLAKILSVTKEELDDAVVKLDMSLESRGIRLLKINDQLELVTSPETSDAINKIRKDELVRDIGKAGSETLAVVLYRGPVSRADIDYIRGVNCSFILRNLQIRGLVKKVQDKENSRSYKYEATPELLKHLGITHVSDLPNYEQMRKELDKFEQEQNKKDEISNNNVIQK